MINSRLGLFSAACSGSCIFTITLSRHPLSRSYGVILPSSLTGVFPLVLGFSPCLPVSVCGTGTLILGSSFSRQREISSVRYLNFAPHNGLRFTAGRALLSRLPCRLDARYQRCAVPILLCPCFPKSALKWYRNLNLLSITYAFWPRLRSRLTLSGRAFLRKP